MAEEKGGAGNNMKSEAALDERNKKSTGWKRKDGGKYARTR